MLGLGKRLPLNRKLGGGGNLCATEYNGVDQYSFVADNGALDVAAATTDYCLVGTFKANGDGAVEYYIGKNVNASINGRVGFIKTAPDIVTFLYQTSTGAALIPTSIDGDTDTDLHVFVARIDLSGSMVYVYVDEVLQNVGGTAFTGTFAALANQFEFYIGAGNNSNGSTADEFADTQIRDVRVYHKDITSVSDLGKIQNRVGIGGEIAWWMLGTSGETDQTGNYDLTNVGNPSIICPSYEDVGEIIPVIVGQTLHIYGDAIANTPVVNTLSVSYICDIGTQSGNDFIIDAVTGDIGELYLHIEAKNNGIVIRKTRSLLVIKAKVNTGTKTITLLGDSLIERGGDSELVELRSIFSGMTWTGIGLTNSAPDLREGYASRTYEWLVENASSPFTKAGVVDIPAYYTDNGLSVPDFVYMRCGVNTAFNHPPAEWSEADSNEWIAWITELVDGFLAHDGSIQVVVALTTICTTSAAVWEAENPGNPYQDNYITIIHQMWDAIIAAFADYDVRVTVGYAPWQLDRTDGYNDDVHPNGDGYNQLGEGLANSINNLL